jgi:two-component sensor histidine kinase
MALDLRLSPGSRAPAEARRSLSEGLRYLDPETLYKLRLLVTELVTNSVRHGDLDDEDSIGLTIQRDHRRIRVSVTDPGEGFEPDRPRPDADLTSGWGLFLVDRLADRWGVQGDGETLVWFEIDY